MALSTLLIVKSSIIICLVYGVYTNTVVSVTLRSDIILLFQH